MCLPGTGTSDPRRTPGQPHPQVKRSLSLSWRLRSGFALPQPPAQPLILIDAEALIVVVAAHAAEYERQGAEYLQAHQVANPTVLDVRGFYNFGPGNAAAIARAQNDELMSSQITGLTADQFKANGIDAATTTVGQWRASISSKIGQSAANSQVLLANS